VEVPRSVILVTVDCLRADHVGFNGYSRPTTPYLDSLAEESAVFSNAIVAGTPTYYSFPGIMASRHPMALGRDVVGLSPAEPTLATVLQEAGYATGAFLAANPYLSPRFGYERGFDTFRDFLDEKVVPSDCSILAVEGSSFRSTTNRVLRDLSHRMGPVGDWYDELYFRYGQRKAPAITSMKTLQRFPSADKIVDTALDWLGTAGNRPFFLWLHLMDPHAPYYPPEEALAWMGDAVIPERARYVNSFWNRGGLSAGRFVAWKEQITGLYDAGIRWVDAQVKRLVAAVREAGRWQNCVFALTADHGEQFLDHGERYHAPAKLTEELIRVPLLLRLPERRKRRVPSPFSLLRVAPTILETVGVSLPREFQGHTLGNEEGNAVATAECVAGCNNPYRQQDRMGARVLAIREQRHKLTVDFRSKRVDLFDLQEDPEEAWPLSEEVEKPVRRRLLECARLHLERSQGVGDPVVRLRARLNDLRAELQSTTS